MGQFTKEGFMSIQPPQKPTHFLPEISFEQPGPRAASLDTRGAMATCAKHAGAVADEDQAARRLRRRAAEIIWRLNHWPKPTRKRWTKTWEIDCESKNSEDPEI